MLMEICLFPGEVPDFSAFLMAKAWKIRLHPPPAPTGLPTSVPASQKMLEVNRGGI